MPGYDVNCEWIEYLLKEFVGEWRKAVVQMVYIYIYLHHSIDNSVSKTAK